MIAIYPGSFDPVTEGHLAIIRRAALISDKLIVAIMPNTSKDVMFTLEERFVHLVKATKHIPNVEIKQFEGLQIEFAKRNGAKVIIRGVRTTTDVEYELKIALANRHMTHEVETLLLPSDAEYSYLSSSLVKEIARFGGDISKMVPTFLEREMLVKFAGKQEVLD